MKRGDKCPRCGYIFKKFSALRCPKCQLPLNPDDLRKYAEALETIGL